MGAENACAYITAAIPRVQTLQQKEHETPTGFISRLRGERTRLLELAKGTPLESDVANTLTDRAVIRTFHSGLILPKYQVMKETIMRGTLSTTSSAATITTLADLASEVSREMAVMHPKVTSEPPIQHRRRGSEVVFSRIGIDTNSANNDDNGSESDGDMPSYNAIRTEVPDHATVPAYEIQHKSNRVTKETTKSTTKHFENEQVVEDADEDEGTPSRRKSKTIQPPTKGILKHIKTSTGKAGKKRTKPVSDSGSSSEDEPLAKKRKPDVLQLATLKLISDISQTLKTPAAPNKPPAAATPKPHAAGPSKAPRLATITPAATNIKKRHAMCFCCNEKVEDLRDHDCAQKRAKTFRCPNCNLTLHGKTLCDLFEHFPVCPKKYCGKCKTNDHSFYYCGQFRCYDCKQFGHSKILHKLGPKGAAIIQAHSTDEPT
jgi:hypothetical protein